MQLLLDPLGRHRFRSWLVSTQREAMLDLWWAFVLFLRHSLPMRVYPDV